MQSDIKRMLACSTMGQMGFMMVQCGLGLFPAAIAHLCWHGLFKAYLFLSSGSGAQEKRLDLGYPPSLKLLMVSLLCGVFGAAGFVLVTQKDMAAVDTTLVFVGLAFLAGAQAAMPLLGTAPLRRLLAVGVVTFGLGGLYGFSVHGVEAALGSLNILQPQPLAALHVVGFGLLFTSWLAMLYKQPLAKAAQKKTWALRLYVQMLNASQPHATTVTAHRNQYQYR
jgi:NAD(P)H-quinone oxidoreductase subunit 5